MKHVAFVVLLSLLTTMGLACTQPQLTATPIPEPETSQRISPTAALGSTPEPDVTDALIPPTSPTLAPEDTPTPAPIPTPTDAPTPTPIPEPNAQFEANATEGQAPFTVTFANLSENANAFQWDFGDGTTSSPTIGEGPVTHEYTKAGTYQITLLALKEGQTDSASTATVSVTVEPGPLFEAKIEPDALTTAPAEEQLFTVIALDQFGNEISGLSYVFSADDKAGEVDDTGKFTVGTVAGTYSAAVSAEVAQGSIAKSVAVDITIEHGAMDHLLLTPETVELGIGGDQKFSAVAVDAYDNPISEAEITWAVDAAVGTIAGDGNLSVGTLAGTFEQGVEATASFNAAKTEATASVAVIPGPAAALFVPPIEINAGATQQLQASVTDEYGNSIEGVEVTWSVSDENAGSISSSGLLTAGEVVGGFGDAIEANATIGDLTTTGSVKITPGALAQIVIAPDPVSIGMEITQQFVAGGADGYGNRIFGLDFTWSVEEGGGNISAGGLFTAGSVPGTYNKTVKASAVQGDVTASQKASVTVEPDRIAFSSNRGSGSSSSDIYVMNADGTNTRRVTTNEYALTPAWSANSRQIVSIQNRGMVVMNDDGSWPIIVAEDFIGLAGVLLRPAMSPDGGRIAFVVWAIQFDKAGKLDFEKSSKDLFLMDVDGGNVTQLTDTASGDELYPSWSPDGTKIVYDFTPTGRGASIWVMEEDGSNQKNYSTLLVIRSSLHSPLMAHRSFSRLAGTETTKSM